MKQKMVFWIAIIASFFICISTTYASIGDIYYGSTTYPFTTALHIGSSGNCLTSNGSIPGWSSSCGSGGTNYFTFSSSTNSLSPSTTTTSIAADHFIATSTTATTTLNIASSTVFFAKNSISIATTSTTYAANIQGTTTTSGLVIQNLKSAVLGVDGKGNVIATTTSSGGTNYWTSSGSNLSNNTGTNVGINGSGDSDFALTVNGNLYVTDGSLGTNPITNGIIDAEANAQLVLESTNTSNRAFMQFCNQDANCGSYAGFGLDGSPCSLTSGCQDYATELYSYGTYSSFLFNNNGNTYLTADPSGDIFLPIIGECDGATSAIATDVNNQLYCNTFLSDERAKTNIVSMSATSTLAGVMALNPVTFNWNDAYASTTQGQEQNISTTTEQDGLLAQQVMTIFPDAVSTTTIIDHYDYIATTTRIEGKLRQSTTTVPVYLTRYTVDYQKLVPYLVSSIQAQQMEIVRLEGAVSALQESSTP